MPLTKELLTHYQAPVFIETGSHTGDGIALALDCGFPHVFSIELAEKWFAHCQARFHGDERVTLLFGDSGDKLGELVTPNGIDSDSWLSGMRATLWLDGHFSGGDTARGPEESPLLRELHHLARAERNDYTIIIDDLRTFSRATTGFDTQDLVNVLKVINPRYRLRFWPNILPSGFVVENDILVGVV